MFNYTYSGGNEYCDCHYKKVVFRVYSALSLKGPKENIYFWNFKVL